MTTAATGHLGKALELALASLAGSATFRTLVGAATPAAAAASIHLMALPEPASNAEYHSAAELATYRPFAVIGFGDARRDRTAVGQYVPTGVVRIYLEKAIAAGDVADPREATIKWLNTVEGICADLEALAETPGYLLFESIGLDEIARAGRDDEEVEGAHQFAKLALTLEGGGGGG